jgi:hypothetical protein
MHHSATRIVFLILLLKSFVVGGLAEEDWHTGLHGIQM